MLVIRQGEIVVIIACIDAAGDLFVLVVANCREKAIYRASRSICANIILYIAGVISPDLLVYGNAAELHIVARRDDEVDIHTRYESGDSRLASAAAVIAGFGEPNLRHVADGNGDPFGDAQSALVGGGDEDRSSPRAQNQGVGRPSV